MRVMLVRNSLVAFFNGLVTLIILLIAPLGLAAVVTGTVAVAFSSMVVGAVADSVVRYLTGATLVRPLPREERND